VRLLAVAVLLLASCQTTRQAKIVTIGATSVALVGGYFEHEARSDGGSFRENIPITFGFAGAIALVSFASIFWLDEVPIEGSDEWRPSDYRAGTELLVGIQRTACFGSCPAYTLAVYRGGAGNVDGHRVRRSRLDGYAVCVPLVSSYRRPHEGHRSLPW
jgi:hypothetical protein